MKKTLVAVTVGLLLLPSLSFAQTSTSTAYQNALLQLISLLTQQVGMLQAQLAVLQTAPKQAAPTTTPAAVFKNCDSTIDANPNKSVVQPRTYQGQRNSSGDILFTIDLYPGCDYDSKASIAVLKDGALLQNLDSGTRTFSYSTPTSEINQKLTFTFQYKNAKSVVAVQVR